MDGQISESLHAAAWTTEDSTILRWAPVNDTLFRQGLTHGYAVSKYTLEGDSIRAWQIDPWSLAEWRANVDSTRFDNLRHRYAAIAAEMAVGDGPELSNGLSVSLEDLDESRFTYALLSADFSALAAEGLGLRLVDKHQDGMGPFVYQVQIRDTTALGFAVVDPAQQTVQVVLPRPEARQSDRLVELLVSPEDGGQLIAGYILEKSEMESGPFLPLNEAPLVAEVGQDMLTFLDSLDENYTPYYYRVKGITVFGDYTEPSGALVVSGRDFTPPPAPANISAAESEDQQIRLEWEWEGQEEIAGFLIYRSSSYQGEYEIIDSQIIGNDARNYLDQNPVKELPNYYRIAAVDTAGNTSQSLDVMVTLDDFDPPPVVTGMTGSIDTAGRVLMQWDENPAIDLIGYRIYYANAPDHTFIILNSAPLPFPEFYDSISLKTLTPYIYYRVSAVDNNYNESELSDTLRLIKPLKIPIQQPIIHEYKSLGESISLTWAPCSNSLASGYILQRKSDRGTDWVEIVSSSDLATVVYHDSTVEQGQIYQYRLKTTSLLTTESPWSQEVSVQMRRSRVAGLIVLQGAKTDQGIQLSWDYDRRGDYKILVYRETAEGKLKYFRSVPQGEELFIDVAPNVGENSYSVRAHHPDGTKSPYSRVVAIDY